MIAARRFRTFGNSVVRLALYQPDIPQNVGAFMRLAACLGVELHLIEPFGFVWSEQRIKRSGLDYRDLAVVTRHRGWDEFLATSLPARLVLLTTRAAVPYVEHAFADGDVLLLGRESAGVPDEVHTRADIRLRVPMKGGARSLNVVSAAAMVLGEALRQTGGFTADGFV